MNSVSRWCFKNTRTGRKMNKLQSLPLWSRRCCLNALSCVADLSLPMMPCTSDSSCRSARERRAGFHTRLAESYWDRRVVTETICAHAVQSGAHIFTFMFGTARRDRMVPGPCHFVLLSQSASSTHPSISSVNIVSKLFFFMFPGYPGGYPTTAPAYTANLYQTGSPGYPPGVYTHEPLNCLNAM